MDQEQTSGFLKITVSLQLHGSQVAFLIVLRCVGHPLVCFLAATPNPCNVCPDSLSWIPVAALIY